VISLDKRVASILRLEDQRSLDDGSGANLLNLVTDTDARVRRRAAIAVGRVGLDAGVPALVGALSDADGDVRAAAAFALGLIGAATAADPLITALADAEPSVRTRAAEALGLIGEPRAAGPAAVTPAGTAIAAMASGCRADIAPLTPDDERWPISGGIEVCRAAILALTRMRQFDPLAKVILDDAGKPVSTWWLVAYALQRVGDKRAAAPLAALLTVDGINTPSFAFRGLGGYGDRRGIAAARSAAERRTADVRLRVAAVRMLGQLKDAASIPLLLRVLGDQATPPNLSLEIVTALGVIGDEKSFDALADLFSNKWAPLRAAAMASAAKVDPDAFLILASGVGLDKDWTVRASLAAVLAPLDPERVRGLVSELASESDPRVQAPALEALARVGAPDLDARIAAALEAPDFNVRATAAGLTAERKRPGAAGRLAAAYARGKTDANESARAAALDALAKLGKDAASATLHEALNDADWSIRLRAEALLRGLGDTEAKARRPAPVRFPADYYESPALLRPVYSPHAFIETKYGTIEIELNVVDAPLATQSFVALARKGYFNGMRIHRVVPNFVVQAGDDRGDGAGSPGYTLRDELSPIPFRRGTVGMALGGKDTGGSQFFITVSPQPHLDDKYPVFGEVVRGMEFVDRITIWDVIERVRVWDGVSF
jgi:cyclophilin family peptidyl-prolyl cis-trans isomerase/HEAT repeat protein